jgi:O-antigen/teichoic acid export membrane protein
MLKKGGIYVASSGLSQALMFGAWLILPWGFENEELGQFALALFEIELVSRLILMGMDSVLIRFLAVGESTARVLRAVATWFGVGVLLALGGLWLTSDAIAGVYSGLETVNDTMLWWIAAAAVFKAASTLIFAYNVALGRAPTYAKLVVLQSCLLSLGYVAAASAGWTVLGLVVAHVGTSIVVVITHIPKDSGVWELPDAKAMREAAAYGMPMMLYSLFAVVSDYTGRLVIGRFVSLGALGTYQFYHQIASQVNGLVGSLNRAWTPYVFGLLDSAREAGIRLVLRAVTVSGLAYTCALVGAVLAGELGLWRVIFPQAMSPHINILYVLLLGPLFVALYTSIYPVFYFARDTVRISAIQTALSVATMGLSIMFTVQMHSLGSAIAWVVSAFASPLVYIVSFPALRKELMPAVGVIVVWGVTAAAFVGFLQLTDNPLISAAALVLGGALVLWQDKGLRRRISRAVAPASNTVPD